MGHNQSLENSQRQAVLKHLYILLFSLSIILINPIGVIQGQIWTLPKVFVVLLICIFNLLILWEEREDLKLPQSWKISKLLWEIFLGVGLISSLTSPFPLRSLFGQEQMGDDLLYWLLIAIFTLTNSLLLELYPELARCQRQRLKPYRNAWLALTLIQSTTVFTLYEPHRL